MSPTFLILCDRLAFPLRWLVEKVYLFARSFQGERNRENKIVLIKLAGMGTLIRIAYVARHHQTDLSKIILITSEEQEEVVKLLPVENNVVTKRLFQTKTQTLL
jgi:hypothetical protein